MIDSHNESARLYGLSMKSGVRTGRRGAPDAKDIRDVSNHLFHSSKEFAEALRHDRATRMAVGGVGGRGTVRGGVGSNCQPGGVLRNADGSLAQGGASSRANMVTGKTSDPRCLLNIPCDADILAWNTIGLAGFGAGGLVGNTVTPASAPVSLTPTNSTVYFPSYLFAEVRDVGDSNVAVFGGIGDFTIQSQLQTQSSGVNGFLPTSMFSVDTPLDCRTFVGFSSIPNQQLQFLVYAPTTGEDINAFGCFWGVAQ